MPQENKVIIAKLINFADIITEVTPDGKWLYPMIMQQQVGRDNKMQIHLSLLFQHNKNQGDGIEINSQNLLAPPHEAPSELAISYMNTVKKARGHLSGLVL